MQVPAALWGNRPSLPSSAAIVLLILTSLPIYVVGTMSEILVAEFEWSPQHVGLAIGGYFLSGVGASYAFSGGTTESNAPTYMLNAGMIAFCATVGMSLTLHWWWSVAACLGLAGSANAVAQPAVNVRLRAVAHSSVWGRTFALKQFGTPTAVLIGGLLLALTGGGPMWTIYIVSVAAALLLFVALFRRTGHEPTVGRSEFLSRGSSSGAHPPGGSMRLVAAIAVGCGCGSAVGNSLVAYAALTWSMSREDSLGLLGPVVGWAGGLSLMSRLFVGWCSDRVVGTDRWAPMVAAASSIGGVLLLLYGSSPFHFVSGIVLSIGVGWSWPVIAHVSIARRMGEHLGRATGLIHVGFMLGAFIGPLMSGALLASGTPRYVMFWILSLSVFSFTSFGLVAAMWPSGWPSSQ